jgi:hypothetical protein
MDSGDIGQVLSVNLARVHPNPRKRAPDRWESVLDRTLPDEVTVALVFRALTLEPALLPSILAADEIEEETRQRARAGKTFSLS